MTMKQAAQTAIDCQDACNLSGVLGSLKGIVFDVLWPEARRLGKGTEWVNQHPICTLMLDKLCDLNRVQREDAGFGRAWDQCTQIAEATEDVTVTAK